MIALTLEDGITASNSEITTLSVNPRITLALEFAHLKILGKSLSRE